MFKLIAVVDRSHIIREGIASLLRANDLCRRIGILEGLDEWRLAFKDIDPDLMIIGAELWQKGDQGRLRNKYRIGEKTAIVGMIHQYYDKETVALFDETIFITDSEETILSKLRHLKKQNGETTKALNLTAREKDVLKLLLQGLSNKEVADRLVISTHTVISHRKNIIEKTGIRSLSGLAVYALLNNISGIDRIG